MKLLPTSFATAIAALALLPAAAAAVPNAPPRPVVGVPGGPHRIAAQGSYCWDGPRGALCADTTDPMGYAPTVRIPAGADPVIRMGYPVKAVFATVAGNDLDVEPLGETKRKFVIHLPEKASRRPLKVYLSASYDRGDGLFAIKIAARGR